MDHNIYEEYIPIWKRIHEFAPLFEKIIIKRNLIKNGVEFCDKYFINKNLYLCELLRQTYVYYEIEEFDELESDDEIKQEDLHKNFDLDHNSVQDIQHLFYNSKRSSYNENYHQEFDNNSINYHKKRIKLL